MPRKKMTPSRRRRLFLMKVFRALGLHGRADVYYASLLEGMCTARKLRLLYETARGAEGAGSIAEIGSWKGKSTVALALAVKRSGRHDTVYAIDHHQGSEEHQETVAKEGSTWPAFQQTIREAGVEDVVEPLKMRSLDAVRVLEEQGVRLKFLFVDGAHDEESVTRDLEAFLPFMLPGGLIAMDDAGEDVKGGGVWRAYQKVLGPRSSEVERAGRLLLVRLTEPPARRA